VTAGSDASRGPQSAQRDVAAQHAGVSRRNVTLRVPEVGVAVVGFGWMGQVHARAHARLLQHYPDAPLRPRLVAVADPSRRAATSPVGAYGFVAAYADWAELLARDDVGVVSVTGPNYVHAEVGVAAARAGKHVWVEKPVGRDLADTLNVA